MFLYISKAFDWVWHDDFLYKLRVVGICGGFNLIQSFFNNRHQRVILNSHHEKDL